MLLAVMAAALPGASARAQERRPLPCPVSVFEGRVEHGEAFEAPFAAGLVFRLDPRTHPRNPQGWTLRVTPAGDAKTDYAEVATPPYRSSNPRYLDNGYGITARAALEWTPRELGYVANRREYEAARQWLNVVLWPYGHTETEIAAAWAALENLQSYRGRLWIEGGATGPLDADPAMEVIKWMRFRVELCRPEGAGLDDADE